MMRILESLRDGFERWVFQTFPVSREGLRLLRVAFGAYLFLFVAPTIGERAWMSGLPDELFYPPLGPMVLFDGFPPSWFFVFLEVLILLSSLTLLFGFFTSVSALVAAGAMFFYNGFLFSFEGVSPGLHLLNISLVCLTLTGWGESTESGEASSLEHEAEYRQWPLTLLAFILGFAFLTAGVQKLTGGWLLLEDQAVRNYLERNMYAYGRFGAATSPLSSIQSEAFWELGDWSTVLFEIGFFAAICSRRVFRFFCAFAILFHTGVLLLLDISFVYMLVVYAVFLDWRGIAGKLAATGAGCYVRRLSRQGAIEERWRSLLAVAMIMIVGKVALEWLSVLEFGTSTSVAVVIPYLLAILVVAGGIVSAARTHFRQ